MYTVANNNGYKREKMEAGEKKLTDVTTNYFNEKMIKKYTERMEK